MTDQEKLRTLAKWFDNCDKSSIGGVTGTQVQDDLRRIANELQVIASLRSELAEKEKEIEVLKRAVITLSQFLN